jgi:hypothetical protein
VSGCVASISKVMAQTRKDGNAVLRISGMQVVVFVRKSATLLGFVELTTAAENVFDLVDFDVRARMLSKKSASDPENFINRTQFF